MPASAGVPPFAPFRQKPILTGFCNKTIFTPRWRPRGCAIADTPLRAATQGRIPGVPSCLFGPVFHGGRQGAPMWGAKYPRTRRKTIRLPHQRIVTSNHGRCLMLVLTRRLGEAIVISDDIIVKVVEIDGQKVRLAIEAPRSVRIDREEVRQRMLAAEKAEETPFACSI